MAWIKIIDENGEEKVVDYGFNDVYIYKFEDFKDNPERAVENICNFVGTAMPVIKEEDYKRKWNIGYNERQIRISRKLNKLFKTRLNPNGIISLRYTLHPHKVIFQKDLFFRLSGKRTKLLPVYEHSKKLKEGV